MSTSVQSHDGIPETGPIRIALVGTGTIGLSFLALHLNENPLAQISIYDTRPNLEDYITSNLPAFLQPSHKGENLSSDWKSRIQISPSLESAVETAHVIQEQGPENAAFKTSLWEKVEASASPKAIFWSSTSGIPASIQAAKLKDKTRLLVVHPYNPPHLMPLLEIVPSSLTAENVLAATLDYWRNLGRSPVVLRKETTGFVANRLAFSLFREAISLVRDDVIGVEDLDILVENSMGPRWAVAGPFKSYHAGGGEAGLEGFLRNIGGTVKECWVKSEEVKVGPGGKEEEGEGEGWEEQVSREAERVYGRVDLGERDRVTRAVLEAVRKEKRVE